MKKRIKKETSIVKIATTAISIIAIWGCIFGCKEIMIPVTKRLIADLSARMIQVDFLFILIMCGVVIAMLFFQTIMTFINPEDPYGKILFRDEWMREIDDEEQRTEKEKNLLNS